MFNACPTNSSVGKLFLYYGIPSVLGFLAFSCSTLVDGIFIGNYIGHRELAAINLLYPWFSAIYGVSLMLGAGGAVAIGNLLGRGEKEKASSVFTQIMGCTTTVSIAMALAIYICRDELIQSSVDRKLVASMLEYLRVFIPVLVIQSLMIVLFFLVKSAGDPIFPGASLVVGAVVNLTLNYLFLAKMSLGIREVAIATGIAALFQLFFVTLPILRGKVAIKFTMIRAIDHISLIKICANGVSELINEMAIGCLTMALNLLILRRYGISGVAAFAVVGYLLFVIQMTIYGVSESMSILVSHNYGARLIHRTKRIVMIGLATTITISVMGVLLLNLFSSALVSMFTNNDSAISYALGIIPIMSIVTVLSAINITICSSFTGVGNIRISSLTSILRVLVLPVFFIGFIVKFFPEGNFYWGLVVSETVLALFTIHRLFRQFISITEIISGIGE